jgi:MFS family permease
MNTDELNNKKNLKDLYIARADRLPTWGLSYLLIFGLAFSFFITLYDVINIGFALPYISFVTTAEEASLAASLGLFGYAVGGPLFSIAADRIGRKPMLLFTALTTSIGSFGDALSFNIPTLYLFRFITGMGIGGDLVLVMTYISEMAPNAKRRSYVNLAFIGGWAGIGFGPFFSSLIVTSYPIVGWRYLFVIGGVIAIAVIVIRAISPETIRFLANKGEFKKADNLIKKMEATAMKRAHVTSLPEPNVLEYTEENKGIFKTLFSKKYRKRLTVLFLFMFWQYFVDYMFLALAPTWVKDILHVPAHELAYMITLLGIAGLGAFIGALLIRPLADKFDIRKLSTAGVIGYAIGTTIMAIGGVYGIIYLFFIGAFIAELIGVGWYQAYYMMDAENFPTSSRTTGYGFADGLGHLGGAIGTAIFIPIVLAIGSVLTWSLMWIPNIIMCIILFFTLPNATGKRLEEINEAS